MSVMNRNEQKERRFKYVEVDPKLFLDLLLGMRLKKDMEGNLEAIEITDEAGNPLPDDCVVDAWTDQTEGAFCKDKIWLRLWSLEWPVVGDRMPVSSFLQLQLKAVKVVKVDALREQYGLSPLQQAIDKARMEQFQNGAKPEEMVLAKLAEVLQKRPPRSLENRQVRRD